MWELEWKNSLRTAKDLSLAGLIGPDQEGAFKPLLEKYQFVLPRYYAGLIDPHDPNCPIRKQAIPTLEELGSVKGYVEDPLQDLGHKAWGPVTHRYQNRALIHLTPNCSMYCRYCFRKNLLNDLKSDFLAGGLDTGLEYLGQHPEIDEVIFSGGDPWMVSDSGLKRVLQRLDSFPHIKRIRFHTRVPVTFPARVTDALVDTLFNHRFPVVVVTHFNHAREITPQSTEACLKVRDAGAWMLNQSVLLRGVNDDCETLRRLSEELFEIGILPYYLHHPDPAAGTSHFDLTVQEGLAIYHELRASLSGYLVPRYVRDIVGEPYKKSVEALD